MGLHPLRAHSCSAEENLKLKNKKWSVAEDRFLFHEDNKRTQVPQFNGLLT